MRGSRPSGRDDALATWQALKPTLAALLDLADHAANDGHAAPATRAKARMCLKRAAELHKELEEM